jgi:hypothetical protein
MTSRNSLFVSAYLLSKPIIPILNSCAFLIIFPQACNQAPQEAPHNPSIFSPIFNLGQLKLSQALQLF